MVPSGEVEPDANTLSAVLEVLRAAEDSGLAVASLRSSLQDAAAAQQAATAAATAGSSHSQHPSQEQVR